MNTDVFQYLWMFWIAGAVYRPIKYNVKQKIHLFIVLCINVWTIFIMVAQIFFISNLRQFLNNFPMNFCLVINGTKFAYTLSKRHKLILAENLFARLHRIPLTPDQIVALQKVRTTSLQWIVFLSFCYVSTNASAAVNAALSNRQQLLYDVWLPYEWKGTYFAYWTTFVYHCLAQFTLALQSVMVDLNGPIYLNALNTYLLIVMNRIESLSKDPTKSEDENIQNLIECIKDHRIIISIFDTLQEAFSNVIFFQFMATILVFSTSALIYLFYQPNLSELAYIIFFMVSEILEIFPGCYYSDRFMTTTDKLVTAIYSSNWVDQSLRFKRTMIIFMQMTQRTKVITAGRVFPVNQATFLAIMKSTYSVLALAQRIAK